MNRLSDNDKSWGPFTLGSWYKNFSLRLSSGGGDEEYESNHILATGFSRALRIKIPSFLKPYGEKYDQYPVEYGASLCGEGEGYDFLQLFFGPQTHDSSTTKSWSKFLPWKQWDCVRSSVYTPDGAHFAMQKKGKFDDFMAEKEKCPASYFKFEDYDGEVITATCKIEEREWHRGEGWFKWLKYFWPAKVRRSLDLWFSSEVGPGKVSWKGGTLGHGIDMLKGETPKQAFVRYCGKGYDRKGRNTPLKFLEEI